MIPLRIPAILGRGALLRGGFRGVRHPVLLRQSDAPQSPQRRIVPRILPPAPGTQAASRRLVGKAQGAKTMNSIIYLVGLVVVVLAVLSFFGLS